MTTVLKQKYYSSFSDKNFSKLEVWEFSFDEGSYQDLMKAKDLLSSFSKEKYGILSEFIIVYNYDEAQLLWTLLCETFPQYQKEYFSNTKENNFVV